MAETPAPAPTQGQNSNQKSPLQKLYELENVTDVPLIRVTSVFPFTLFPSTVTMDRTKVTVVNSYFFFSSQVKSFMLKDIATVSLEEGAFFAKMTVIGIAPRAEKLVVRYLWKEDARRFRRMLEGLLIALKEGVDVFNISDQDLLNHLEEIGKANA